MSIDKEMLVRGCATQSEFKAYGGKLDCHSVDYQAVAGTVSATGCFCGGDMCNGGGFSLSAVRRSTQWHNFIETY